jgi:predicted nucleotidyltransferase component of viral defense system
VFSKNSIFYKQVKLLLQVLPSVAKEKIFALKGGTAINLFWREIPRLSVDIDLTYLIIEPREKSLKTISKGLNSIAVNIEKTIPTARVRFHHSAGSNGTTKLFVQDRGVQIIVEPNLVTRGSVFPPETKELSPKATEYFEMTTSIQTVSFADLYGGKICAALDRQHPRDFFDLLILYENEGLTESIRRAFVIYLVCNDRPISELLNPTKTNFLMVFRNQLMGMTDRTIAYEELERFRDHFISDIRNSLKESERLFIFSIKNCLPQWELMGLPGIEKLPAIQWKIENVRRMEKKKHKLAVEKLKKILDL